MTKIEIGCSFPVIVRSLVACVPWGSGCGTCGRLVAWNCFLSRENAMGAGIWANFVEPMSRSWMAMFLQSYQNSTYEGDVQRCPWPSRCDSQRVGYSSDGSCVFGVYKDRRTLPCWRQRSALADEMHWTHCCRSVDVTHRRRSVVVEVGHQDSF